MKAIILSSQYGTYNVLLENNTQLLVKPRGLFRHKKIKPVVGDIVIVDEHEFVICDILDRKNYLIRPSIANVDEVAIIMSTSEPNFSSLLIDKFISYANYFKIPACVIISKADKNYDEVMLNKKIDSLEKIGVKAIIYSNVTKLGLDKIKELFAHKNRCFNGTNRSGKI